MLERSQPTRSLTAQDFLRDHAPSIEGWLYNGAVELTEILLSAQETMGIPGGVAEIGVFKGKYLSFLCAASGRRSVGLDIFMFGQIDIARANIQGVVGNHDANVIELYQANTQSLDSESFAELLAKAKSVPIAFASIDGDHSARGVQHDLCLTESHLAPGGIIAIDDMFSATSPGVSEGFFAYMRSPHTKLEPIAFSDNKLFMTTRGFEELYQIKIKIALEGSTGVCGERWRAPGQTNRVRPFLSGQLLAL